MDMQRRIREARERISGVGYLDVTNHPGLGDDAAGPSRSLAMTPFTHPSAAYMWGEEEAPSPSIVVPATPPTAPDAGASVPDDAPDNTD
eukprot:14500444-Heterocapsa_arctica.AAC.1